MAEKKETKKPAKKGASKSASKAKAAPKAKAAAGKGKTPTPRKAAAKPASAAKGATKKAKAPAKKPAPTKKTPTATAKKTSAAAKKASPKPKAAAKKEKKGPAKKPEVKKKAPAKAKAAPKKPAAKPAAKKTAAKKAPARKKAAPQKKPAKPTPAREAPEKAAEQPTPEPVREGRPGPRTTFPLFDRWDLSEIEVHDAGLARHINLNPTFLPHTGGRLASRPFAKARMNLVERLTNSMMRTEKYTGKKGKTIQVVKRAFETVEKRAKRHPVQVLVEALENAAPREEITRLRFGGISVPRAVDVAPARRLDVALRHLCRGAVSATYKNRRPIHQCLAEEILMAASGDVNSYAIGKKEEMERVAASAR